MNYFGVSNPPSLIIEVSGSTCRVRIEIVVVSKFVYYIIMALSEVALKKLSKNKLSTFPPDYQNKFDSTLASIRNELSGLKKDWETWLWSVCS